ncbi:MAG: glycosyltransferase family 1 protein [bacterium]
MRVQISTCPIRQASRVRGVGIYTRQLEAALVKKYPGDQYTVSSTLQSGIDLIHYPYFEPFFLTMPLTHSVPVVVTVHDLIPLKYPEHFPKGLRGTLKWQLQKLAVRRANHIITDSKASAEDIARILHYPAQKISVIPLASGAARTTTKTKAKVVADYQLPARFALYVGDLNWNKNIPGLIREFSKLENSTLHLVLVGQAFTAKPPSFELLQVQAAVAASGARDKIHLIGYVPSHHLPGIYSLATIYVQPSWDEGFGLTLLEAMAADCPVISSSRGSLPEVGGDAVIYFNPGKPGDLTEKLATLTRSPDVRSQLVELGRLQLKRFSWDQTAELTHAIYEKVLANH